MIVSLKTIYFFSGVIAMLSLSACNGLFENIYDKPLSEKDNEYGFINVDEKTYIGQIYINATSHTEWQYINLHDKQVITKAIDETVPEKWDFAVHRYDTKTNNGSVVESTSKDFYSISNINTIPQNAFIPDKWTTDKIAIDMSQMMDGLIIYTKDFYNPCLSKWLNIDTSVMPPIYALSGKIYILQLSDGSYAALKLSNFMNGAGVKGMITIDYLYPLQL